MQRCARADPSGSFSNCNISCYCLKLEQIKVNFCDIQRHSCDVRSAMITLYCSSHELASIFTDYLEN